MRELDIFLKGIEKRAFRIAQLATHCEADSLDIVQDTMIKLVTNYQQRTPEEWHPLFLKILENKILDWHRKQKVKNKLFFWKKDWRKGSQITNEQSDLKPEAVDHQINPESQLFSEQLGQHLLECVESLPLKQQQCFVLRSWEGLSIKETAEVMKINENSVKTHYARALGKLQQAQQTIEDR